MLAFMYLLEKNNQMLAFVYLFEKKQQLQALLVRVYRFSRIFSPGERVYCFFLSKKTDNLQYKSIVIENKKIQCETLNLKKT